MMRMGKFTDLELCGALLVHSVGLTYRGKEGSNTAEFTDLLDRAAALVSTELEAAQFKWWQDHGTPILTVKFLKPRASRKQWEVK